MKIVKNALTGLSFGIEVKSLFATGRGPAPVRGPASSLAGSHMPFFVLVSFSCFCLFFFSFIKAHLW